MKDEWTGITDEELARCNGGDIACLRIFLGKKNSHDEAHSVGRNVYHRILNSRIEKPKTNMEEIRQMLDKAQANMEKHTESSRKSTISHLATELIEVQELPAPPAPRLKPKNLSGNLKRVTITDVNESTDFDELMKISATFPFVEWGIQFDTHPRVGKLSNHASTSWISKLMKIANDHYINEGFHVPISAHLSGFSLRRLLEGYYTPFMESGFTRIYLDFGQDNYDFDFNMENFAANISKYSEIEWFFNVNESQQALDSYTAAFKAGANAFRLVYESSRVPDLKIMHKEQCFLGDFDSKTIWSKLKELERMYSLEYGNRLYSIRLDNCTPYRISYDECYELLALCEQFLHIPDDEPKTGEDSSSEHMEMNLSQDESARLSLAEKSCLDLYLFHHKEKPLDKIGSNSWDAGRQIYQYIIKQREHFREEVDRIIKNEILPDNEMACVKVYARHLNPPSNTLSKIAWTKGRKIVAAIIEGKD